MPYVQRYLLGPFASFCRVSIFLDRNILFFAIVVCVSVCILIYLLNYISFHQSVCGHQLRIQAQQLQAVQSVNAEHNLNIAQRNESALNTYIYYICMILCYCMSCLNYLAQSGHSSEAGHRRRQGLTTVTFLNSYVNPFLYYYHIGDLFLYFERQSCK